ncbi:hypothetical protein [Catalinimonas niigatensis]|uniref:hypothetical protein n=1 Tax=Catalinimonas niigatensis TaxID=1397264 RepID=UPI00266602AD|nr:hypothetical protein [Catalinimonas niigatensis]WPP50523.1 hypothetical protein PZB72_28060 [Catalinimonas niigatensis]
MKNIFLTALCIVLIFTSGCEDNYYDPLGDLIVNFQQSDLPSTPLLNDPELGLFALESLITNEFTPDHAFQLIAFDSEAERVVFTNILPGTYVVAFVATSSEQDVPKKVVQIIANDVKVTDFYF